MKDRSTVTRPGTLCRTRAACRRLHRRHRALAGRHAHARASADRRVGDGGAGGAQQARDGQRGRLHRAGAASRSAAGNRAAAARRRRPDPGGARRPRTARPDGGTAAPARHRAHGPSARRRGHGTRSPRHRRPRGAGFAIEEVEQTRGARPDARPRPARKALRLLGPASGPNPRRPSRPPAPGRPRAKSAGRGVRPPGTEQSPLAAEPSRSKRSRMSSPRQAMQRAMSRRRQSRTRRSTSPPRRRLNRQRRTAPEAPAEDTSESCRRRRLPQRRCRMPEPRSRLLSPRRCRKRVARPRRALRLERAARRRRPSRPRRGGSAPPNRCLRQNATPHPRLPPTERPRSLTPARTDSPVSIAKSERSPGRHARCPPTRCGNIRGVSGDAEPRHRSTRRGAAATRRVTRVPSSARPPRKLRRLTRAARAHAGVRVGSDRR